MYGRPEGYAAQQQIQRAAAQRREMVKDNWYNQQYQRNLVQYCLCGARKLRRTADGRPTTDYYCPNRHRPDHQPGAVYGRPLLVYRPGD